MDDQEAYLLLILSDANLPTGSFVASSGLESTAAHALFQVPGPAGSDILAFLRNTVETYARCALPFARDAHRVSAAYVSGEITQLDVALASLARLDALYDATTLNDVSRRASFAQGAALLTLYTKGFTRPPLLTSAPAGARTIGTCLPDSDKDERESRAGALVAALKLRVRRGESDALGHLPVCWGILGAALGLTVGELHRGAHLHLFLHARGVLSAAVRLNALGPYAAQQLLLHVVRHLVDDAMKRTAHLVSGSLQDEVNLENANDRLPATTWPLGEILAARHDFLHSRIFNS
ncbi:hypothetical protein BGW80DRAFT_1313780 [Lactifluus volemus]|nr:hypothetical protein BGW80DRAFT_1313780 [Lactifluus volemus]